MRTRELLQLAADRAAIAIERARLFHQRGVVEALQRSLMPGAAADRARARAGGALPARAVRRGGIGGDWYDVVRAGRAAASRSSSAT